MTTSPVGGDDAEAEFPADDLHLLGVDMLRKLHGEACIRCGASQVTLRPAGYAYTTTGDGTRYGWPVVTCPEHTGDRPVPPPG